MRIQVRDLNRTEYASTFDAMKRFTAGRTPETADEIWWTEHDPVFTQGQAGRAEHLLDPGTIPVVQSDRGGQVTYHGPGQLVGYLLIDLKRSGLGPRTLVTCIEQSLIAVLEEVGIQGMPRADAPGVYVDGAKIAALGLRIRRGCSYHGLSLNVNMSLDPFRRINPCGLVDIDVTQTADLGGPRELDALKGPLTDQLITNLATAAAHGPRSLDGG